MRRFVIGGLLLAVGAALVGSFWSALADNAGAQDSAAAGQQEGAWEYLSEEVPTFQLMARMNELGQQGWDVFEIERQTLVLENAGGQTSLETNAYQVFARRPR